MRICAPLVAFAAAVGVGAPVFAGLLPEGFEFEIVSNGQTYSLGNNLDDVESVTDLENGSIEVSGVSEAFESVFDWTFVLPGSTGIEPSRSGLAVIASLASALAVTNNSGSDQSYTVTTSALLSDGSVTGAFGSVSGSVGDADFDGDASVSAPAGSSVYNGFVDGIDVLSALDDPFSQTVNTLGATAPFGPGNDSVSGLAGVLTGFGIRNEFTLSAGDQATLNSTIALVPTPGAALVLGVAGLAATRRRR
ncbi:MAG: hypothetical protein AAGD00_07200 [Planctomycetota bacterium]